jgi:predicted anti-sigma-YlaC factor YlaD
MDTCKQITRLVSEGLDRELSPIERIRIRFHLMMCRGCANFARQAQVLRSMSRAFAERVGADRKR